MGFENFTGRQQREDIEPSEPTAGHWGWELKDGRWHERFYGYAEREEAENAVMRFDDDVRKYWRLDTEGAHNEGILRDHPRYPELLKKWGLRYLYKIGSLPSPSYTGRVDDDGFLETRDGVVGTERLTDLISRSTVDIAIKDELAATEGFVDITDDDDRQEELEIYPGPTRWYS